MVANDEHHFGFMGPLIGRAKKVLFPDAGTSSHTEKSENTNRDGKRTKSRARRDQLARASSSLANIAVDSLGGTASGAFDQCNVVIIGKENKVPHVNKRGSIQKMDSLAVDIRENNATASSSRQSFTRNSGKSVKSRGRASIGSDSLASTFCNCNNLEEQSQLQPLNQSRRKAERKSDQRRSDSGNEDCSLIRGNASENSFAVKTKKGVCDQAESCMPKSLQSNDVICERKIAISKAKSRRRARFNHQSSSLVQDDLLPRVAPNKRNYGTSSLMSLPSSATKSDQQNFISKSRKNLLRKTISTNHTKQLRDTQESDNLTSLTKDVEALAIAEIKDDESKQLKQPFQFQSTIQSPPKSKYGSWRNSKPSPSSCMKKDPGLLDTQMDCTATSPLKSPTFHSPLIIRHRPTMNGCSSPPLFVHRLSSLSNSNIFQHACSPFYKSANPKKRLDKKKTPSKLTPASPLVTEFSISPPIRNRNRRIINAYHDDVDKIDLQSTPMEHRQETHDVLAEVANNNEEGFVNNETKGKSTHGSPNLIGSRLFDDQAYHLISNNVKEKHNSGGSAGLDVEVICNLQPKHRPGSAVIECETAQPIIRHACNDVPTKTKSIGVKHQGSAVIEVEKAAPINRIVRNPSKSKHEKCDPKSGKQLTKSEPRLLTNVDSIKNKIHDGSGTANEAPNSKDSLLRRSARESKQTDRLTVAWSETNEDTSIIRNGGSSRLAKEDSKSANSALRRSSRESTQTDRLTVAWNENVSSRKFRFGGDIEVDESMDDPFDDSAGHLLQLNSLSSCDKVESKKSNLKTPAKDSRAQRNLLPKYYNENNTHHSNWSDEEITMLRNAQKNVNPTSVTFWDDVSDLVEERSGSECRDKWFSFVCTPKSRSRPDTKAEVCDDVSTDEDEEDDLFNSTPLRDTVTEIQNGIFAKKFDEESLCTSLGLSPCVQQHSTLNSQLDEISARKQRTGYKTYIDNLRKDLNRVDKYPKKNLYKASNNSIKSCHNVCVDSEEGENKISGKLLPDGTVKLDMCEDSDEDDIYGLDEGFCVEDEDQ